MKGPSRLWLTQTPESCSVYQAMEKTITMKRMTNRVFIIIRKICPSLPSSCFLHLGLLHSKSTFGSLNAFLRIVLGIKEFFCISSFYGINGFGVKNVWDITYWGTYHVIAFSSWKNTHPPLPHFGRDFRYPIIVFQERMGGCFHPEQPFLLGRMRFGRRWDSGTALVFTLYRRLQKQQIDHHRALFRIEASSLFFQPDRWDWYRARDWNAFLCTGLNPSINDGIALLWATYFE